jgi:hypothetical protein
MATELTMAVYPVIGFAITYLALEAAWHFTACRSANAKDLKPCLFKQVRLAMVSAKK